MATIGVSSLNIPSEDGVTNKDLGLVVSMKRLKKPICLSLTPYGDKFWNENTSSLTKVLWAHPELRLESEKFSKQSGQDFFYVRGLNWHGRYLLDRPNLPLSLWPKVLEKANEKPSVIYEFLKGPAFVAKHALAYE